MNPDAFSTTLQWVLGHGYFLILLAMIVEGPIVTLAASFASALGYFNIWIIIALAFLGDIIGDVVFYIIGYLGRQNIVERYGHRIGITRERILSLENHLKKHSGKTLVFIKFFPPITMLGLITVGALKMKLRRYAGTVSLIILPRILFFSLIGYYFGSFYSLIAKYIKSAEWALGIVIALGIIVYYIYIRIAKRVSQKVEEDLDKDEKNEDLQS